MASFQRLLTQIRASIELLLAAFPFVTEIDFQTKALFFEKHTRSNKRAFVALIKCRL